MKPLRLLLLGSLPPPAGGTTLLFAQLVARLRVRPDIELRVVDTGARGLGARALGFARAAAGLAWADVVSLHASPPGIARAGPLLLRGGRSVVVRVFGGSLDLELADSKLPYRERLERTLAGAARVLVETDQVASWLRANRPELRVAIQRNSRVLPPTPPAAPPGRRRFVFLGQVSEAKGVRELAAAMRSAAASGATLDAYGAVIDEAARAELAAAPCVRVHPEVANERVPALLTAADALVLPTKHFAEGHPGAILEAFAAGRTVIATRHRAIPELVEHERTGLLVPAGDSRALAEAIVRLAGDSALAARLGAAAFARAREFDAAVWADAFVARCREVVA